MRLNRDLVLTYSRALGWLLAFLIVAATIMATVQFEAKLGRKESQALAAKREFLAKVRACIHQPGRARRSWHECEVKVRASE